MTDSGEQVRFFPTPQEFRAWLQQHHATTTELLVGFYKEKTGLPSITWPESVDEALCVGWIDGVRRRIDDTCYSIRFTPRKAVSIWSAVNIQRVEELTAEGRMCPAGLAAFAKRSAKKSRTYAYEQGDNVTLDLESERQFRSNPRAWKFFQAQAPWYKKKMIWHVISAKRQPTMAKRLAKLIELSAAGERAP